MKGALLNWTTSYILTEEQIFELKLIIFQSKPYNAGTEKKIFTRRKQLNTLFHENHLYPSRSPTPTLPLEHEELLNLQHCW